MDVAKHTQRTVPSCWLLLSELLLVVEELSERQRDYLSLLLSYSIYISQYTHSFRGTDVFVLVLSSWVIIILLVVSSHPFLHSSKICVMHALSTK